MTQSTSLVDLIAALEKATGPDRELDAEIVVALCIRYDNVPEWAEQNFPAWRARKDGRVECVHSDGSGGLNWKAMRYTASIDAALTLVPEGYGLWLVREEVTGNGRACVTKPDADSWGGGYISTPSQQRLNVASPAIALCIAALRARPPC